MTTSLKLMNKSKLTAWLWWQNPVWTHQRINEIFFFFLNLKIIIVCARRCVCVNAEGVACSSGLRSKYGSCRYGFVFSLSFNSPVNLLGLLLWTQDPQLLSERMNLGRAPRSQWWTPLKERVHQVLRKRLSRSPVWDVDLSLPHLWDLKQWCCGFSLCRKRETH